MKRGEFMWDVIFVVNHCGIKYLQAFALWGNKNLADGFWVSPAVLEIFGGGADMPKEKCYERQDKTFIMHK